MSVTLREKAYRLVMPFSRFFFPKIPGNFLKKTENYFTSLPRDFRLSVFLQKWTKRAYFRSISLWRNWPKKGHFWRKSMFLAFFTKIKVFYKTSRFFPENLRDLSLCKRTKNIVKMCHFKQFLGIFNKTLKKANPWQR